MPNNQKKNQSRKKPCRAYIGQIQNESKDLFLCIQAGAGTRYVSILNMDITLSVNLSSKMKQISDEFNLFAEFTGK